MPDPVEPPAPPPIQPPSTGAAQPVGSPPAAAPPTPLRSLLTTRKGLAVLVASIVVTGFAAAVTASYFQGKLSPTAYFDQLKAAGVALVASWGGYLWSTTSEDVSKNVSPNEAIKAIVGAMADMHTAQSARADAALKQNQDMLDAQLAAIRDRPFYGAPTPPGGTPSKPPPAGSS